MRDTGVTSNLRRSCHFCRSRKIRCSGENICQACRERSIDCIYGWEGSKGRPKGSLSTRKAREESENEIISKKTGAHVAPKRAKRIRAVAQEASNDCLSPWTEPVTTEEPSPRDQCNGENEGVVFDVSIAAELERLFRRTINTPVVPGSEFHLAQSMFKESPQAFRIPNNSTMNYELLFGSLAEKLVEILLRQYSSLDLKSSNLGDKSANYLASSLASDDTQEMFDESFAESSPLAKFDNHKTTQMIEVWFLYHPLSFIVSKTMLFRSRRSDTYDEVLLALILAEVSCFQCEDISGTKEVDLFPWACSRLRHRAMEKPSLSTLQALTLLGWHELCRSRPRRAICYWKYARSAIVSMEAYLAKLPMTEFNRINGVDVGEVEAELFRNIYWVTFAVTLWYLMHFGQPFSETFPANISSYFPPLDHNSSVVLLLDQMSDNVATLKVHARRVRELWPLSHIISITAHIYALYPRADAVQRASSLSRQAQTLLRLRQLSSPSQDISAICGQVRDILFDSLQLPETQTDNRTSQASVSAAYYTMIICLLFPRSVSENAPTTITESIVDDFLKSARALCEVMSVLRIPPSDDRLMTGVQAVLGAHVFAMSLDACGKAMQYCHVHQQSSAGDILNPLVRKQEDIIFLARQLRAYAKHDALLPVARIRNVKKELKSALQCFEWYTWPSVGVETLKESLASTSSGSHRSSANLAAACSSLKQNPISYSLTPGEGPPSLDLVSQHLSTWNTAVTLGTEIPNNADSFSMSLLMEESHPTFDSRLKVTDSVLEDTKRKCDYTKDRTTPFENGSTGQELSSLIADFPCTDTAALFDVPEAAQHLSTNLSEWNNYPFQ